MYHRLASVHHAAKADVYESTRMRAKAAAHRARADWHAHFGRRQRFGNTPHGTELYNAEQLLISLSDPISDELFVDPVFVSSGHTFEREAIVAWLSTKTMCPITKRPITSVLVPNHHARSIVGAFISAYGNRTGGEWADIRDACAFCTAQRQKFLPDYSYGRADWHAHFGRRQRFGNAPHGTELYNAEQLLISLSDPKLPLKELFVDPVFVSSGHTFEREAIVAWLSTNTMCPITERPITSVLVTNHHARSMVGAFISMYGNRTGDEWADIRDACAFCTAQRQKFLPDYSYGQGALDEDDAVAYIRERILHDFPEVRMDNNDDYIRSEIIERATGTTRRELDERYDDWNR
jgi:hypothetical protein